MQIPAIAPQYYSVTEDEEADLALWVDPHDSTRWHLQAWGSPPPGMVKAVKGVDLLQWYVEEYTLRSPIGPLSGIPRSILPDIGAALDAYNEQLVRRGPLTGDADLFGRYTAQFEM